MDHKDDDEIIRYIGLTDSMTDQVASVSEQVYAQLENEAHKQLPSNTPTDQAYVWLLCTCSAILARCLVKDEAAAETNLEIAQTYIRSILDTVR